MSFKKSHNAACYTTCERKSVKLPVMAYNVIAKRRASAWAIAQRVTSVIRCYERISKEV